MSDDNRPRPPAAAEERTMLAGWLDYHRATLELKCAGLAPAQLVTRAAEPSSLSLLGLVRHMADVERGWFRRRLGREYAPPLYYSDDDPDGDFDNVDPAAVDVAFAAWRAECARAREIAEALPSLDVMITDRVGRRLSARWVLVHMVEEYARHNGHADLLRERIDGVTGE
ncbi:DinB family protein [Pseudonocardia sp. DSM 110487]|uniref:DinB family protein n=1 Tax=Pseudonocardia sp. DSM 110487 TaxID=2865833 RepID=UPI00351CFCE6